jgi:asparagine synthase (glutamine-hydrolysing)
MCGIAGFLGDFKPELLRAYNQAMAHRGPDGEGTWHHGPTGLGLAHRRLSIIDLSDAAAQPMQCCGGRYIVSFNGEIYNYKELYNKLKDDYEVNPNSDTAMLAPLYDACGVKMLEHLNGIFAFAIWDREEETLFLARDHVGVKPLYYTTTPQGFAFASELKTLLHTPGVDKTINPSAVADYLTYLWTPGTHTMLEHVHKLRPGHYLLLKKGAATSDQKKYYGPPTSKVYNTDKNSSQLKDFFNVIVKDQCLADVPVGAFLSGGVDSSAIVASMTAQGLAPQHAYCVTFHDSSMKKEGFSDDATYARQAAQHLGIQLTEVPASAKNLERLPDLVRMLEEPLADPAPLYVQDISAAAKADGLKVLLSGTGGDDVFAGYRRHQAAMLRTRLGNLAQPTGHLLNILAHIAPGSAKRRLHKLGYMLSGDENEFLHRAFEFSPLTQTNGLLQDDFMSRAPQKTENALKYALKTSEGLHPLNRLLFMEFHGFMPDLNLTYTDKAGMAEGVEIRVPFLDKRLIDWAKDLPIQQKIQRSCTKYILKKAFENQLPKGFFDRPKAGFGAPMRQWIANDKTGLVRDTLQASEKRGVFNKAGVEKLYTQTIKNQTDGAYTIFSLVMIEFWFQQFSDT